MAVEEEWDNTAGKAKALPLPIGCKTRLKVYAAAQIQAASIPSSPTHNLQSQNLTLLSQEMHSSHQIRMEEHPLIFQGCKPRRRISDSSGFQLSVG